MLSVKRGCRAILEWLQGKKNVFVGLGVALAVMLNVASTISAAVSAHYASKQSELAINAINVQSRNEAFAEYLNAYSDVCDVYLTKFDEDLFITPNPGPWAYDEKQFDFDFEIRQLNVDELAKLPTYDVEAYIAEKRKREAIRWSKLRPLKIWLDSSRDEMADIYPQFNDGLPFETDKRPAPFVALEQQISCLNELEFLMAWYKNPDDPRVGLLRNKRFWVVPISNSKTTEALLSEMGREDILQDMVAAGVWPIPDEGAQLR